MWSRRRRDPNSTGYAVRTDWFDGTHLIFGWRSSWRAVCRLLFRDRRYWRPGPVRPHTWSVVITTPLRVAQHPRDLRCASIECPVGVPLAGFLYGHRPGGRS
jgi:hypothetical protein